MPLVLEEFEKQALAAVDAMGHESLSPHECLELSRIIGILCETRGFDSFDVSEASKVYQRF